MEISRYPGSTPTHGAYSRGPPTSWQIFGRGVQVSRDYKLKQGFFHWNFMLFKTVLLLFLLGLTRSAARGYPCSKNLIWFQNRCAELLSHPLSKCHHIIDLEQFDVKYLLPTQTSDNACYISLKFFPSLRMNIKPSPWLLPGKSTQNSYVIMAQRFDAYLFPSKYSA